MAQSRSCPSCIGTGHVTLITTACRALRCVVIGSADQPRRGLHTTPIRFHSLRQAVVMVDPDASARVTAYDHTVGGPLEHSQGARFLDG